MSPYLDHSVRIGHPRPSISRTSSLTLQGLLLQSEAKARLFTGVLHHRPSWASLLVIPAILPQGLLWSKHYSS